MDKVFKVADIKKLQKEASLGKISYSKMAEKMNYQALEYWARKGNHSLKTKPSKEEMSFKLRELAVVMKESNDAYSFNTEKWINENL